MLYENTLKHINSPEEKNNAAKSDFFITFIHLFLVNGKPICEWMCAEGKGQKIQVLFSSTSFTHYKYNYLSGCKDPFEVLSVTLSFLPAKTPQHIWIWGIKMQLFAPQVKFPVFASKYGLPLSSEWKKKPHWRFLVLLDGFFPSAPKYTLLCLLTSHKHITRGSSYAHQLALVMILTPSYPIFSWSFHV